MTAGSPKGHKVIWTDSEWRAVALALLKKRPDYIDHPNPIFHPLELREAMASVLPPERHRPTPEAGGSMGHFRPGFMKAYEFIRETLTTNGIAIDPELAALADLTLPAAQPLPFKAEDDKPDAPQQSFRNKKRVKWTQAEFTALARWLRERYPGASYLESSTCAALSLTDVRDAMLAVLPRERQRPLFTITPLRPFFVGAFKAAKAEQYREAEKAAREEVAQQRAAQFIPAVAAAPEPVAAPAINPYEAVFAPMLQPIVKLLAAELLAQLGPQIAQMIGTALAALPHQQRDNDNDNDNGNDDEDDQPAPAAEPATRRVHPITTTPTAPAKKVLIGVVGPLPSQRNELERAFPQLHIVTLDGTNTNEAIARLRNARRVIGMTSFMNHSMDGALAKNFSERYMRVHGGVTSIKRQIKVWADSGVLAA